MLKYDQDFLPFFLPFRKKKVSCFCQNAYLVRSNTGPIKKKAKRKTENETATIVVVLK